VKVASGSSADASFWTGADYDAGPSTVNLTREFPGPSLCDFSADGVQTIEVTLPGSVEPPLCPVDTPVPVRAEIGERRVLVYQSDDLPGSITTDELGELLRGERVDRLGDVTLRVPGEEYWAYDIVVDASGAPAEVQDPTAYQAFGEGDDALVRDALDSPSTIVVTSRVVADIADRVACVGDGDDLPCADPDDGWETYPLSRPVVITADGVETMAPMWPVLASIEADGANRRDGWVLDLPEEVTTVEASPGPSHFIDTDRLFLRQQTGLTDLCSNGGESDPIACDRVMAVDGIDLAEVADAVVEGEQRSWYSPAMTGGIDGGRFVVAAVGADATPGSSSRTVRCNEGAPAAADDREIYEQYLSVGVDGDVITAGVRDGRLELEVVVAAPEAVERVCALGVDTSVTSYLATIE